MTRRSFEMSFVFALLTFNLILKQVFSGLNLIIILFSLFISPSRALDMSLPINDNYMEQMGVPFSILSSI